MLGAVLLAGVLNMVTIGEFITQIEATGHPAVQAEGMDRSLPLTEGSAVKIAKEFGVVLTCTVPSREIDASKLQFLVWLLTPQESEARRLRYEEEVAEGERGGHVRHGRRKGHHKSESCPDPEGEDR